LSSVSAHGSSPTGIAADPPDGSAAGMGGRAPTFLVVTAGRQRGLLAVSIMTHFGLRSVLEEPSAGGSRKFVQTPGGGLLSQHDRTRPAAQDALSRVRTDPGLSSASFPTPPTNRSWGGHRADGRGYGTEGDSHLDAAPAETFGGDLSPARVRSAGLTIVFGRALERISQGSSG